MKDRPRTVVVQVTNATKVARKGLVRRLAVGIDAAVAGGLDGCTLHAHDFGHCVAIQGFVFPHG